MIAICVGAHTVRPLSANDLRAIESVNQPFGLRAHTVRPYTDFAIFRIDFTKLISVQI